MASRLPLLFMILVAPAAFAQEFGSQSLSVSGTCAVPALIRDASSTVSGLDFAFPGPSLGIAYHYALGPALEAGADTGFALFESKSGQAFIMVPLTAMCRWTPTMGSFEFSLGGGAGIAYSRFNGVSNVDPLADLALGAGYRLTTSVTIGLSLDNLVLLQVFHQDSSQNCIGYFPRIGFFGAYHLDAKKRAP